VSHTHDPRRRVVVTGLGVVSAAGCDVETFWSSLVAGRSAVGPIRRFDASAYPSRMAAEVDEGVRGENGETDDWASRGRIARFARDAVMSAVADAALPDDPATRVRTGVAMAAGMGSYDHNEVFKSCAAGSARGDFDWTTFTLAVKRHLAPLAAARRTPGSIASRLAREHGCGGPVLAVMTACAGGTQAIGDAARWIRRGAADIVIAGGADSELYPMGLASFCLLGALSRRNDDPAHASRPFDAGRDGFVLGEGAAALVLEERHHAIARGAPIYAEIAGFGSACDAFRVTDPHPAGAGAVLAMTRAIEDARVGPARIDYVNAHGTSTPANDRIESLAIRRVFGDRAPAVPISATKSMIGHATVAAGALEAVVTALTLARQTIHPTINYDAPDPACDLDYVPNVARHVRTDAALSNSFAFGGQSACLVMLRA
jgi:3-oxoacyl-[acyl-carrier-protein] synthase II